MVAEARGAGRPLCADRGGAGRPGHVRPAGQGRRPGQGARAPGADRRAVPRLQDPRGPPPRGPGHPGRPRRRRGAQAPGRRGDRLAQRPHRRGAGEAQGPAGHGRRGDHRLGDAGDPRRHRRGGGGPVRRRPAGHVPPLRRGQGLAVRGPLGLRRPTWAASARSSSRVKGDGVWSRLGYEGGGHRVQRVPRTEAQGRIHTSAATVAVLPETRGHRGRHRLGQGRRRAHQPRRRARRAERQQGRVGHPPGAHAHRHHRLDARREEPAQEPRQGPAHPGPAGVRALPQPAARRRGRRAQEP